MDLLNFIVLLRLGRPLHEIYAEIQKAYGNVADQTTRLWRERYQQKLWDTNLTQGLLMSGGKDEYVVLNETLVDVHTDDGFSSIAPKGIGKFSPAVRTGTRMRRAVRRRIAKTLLGRTIRKKPASKLQKKPARLVTKRPSGKRGTRNDPISNGRRLWAAATVGKGEEVYTHANGKIKFTFDFLPKKADARRGKPRGLDEIRNTLATRARRGSMLIFDGWKSTKTPARRLGFQHVPPINHSLEFRDRETRFHSNDIESENNRLEHWSRVRYSRLSLSELDLHEYTYYVNVGNTMEAIMKGSC
jgi:hypothetical protein